MKIKWITIELNECDSEALIVGITSAIFFFAAGFLIGAWFA